MGFLIIKIEKQFSLLNCGRTMYKSMFHGSRLFFSWLDGDLFSIPCIQLWSLFMCVFVCVCKRVPKMSDLKYNLSEKKRVFLYYCYLRFYLFTKGKKKKGTGKKQVNENAM